MRALQVLWFLTSLSLDTRAGVQVTCGFTRFPGTLFPWHSAGDSWLALSATQLTDHAHCNLGPRCRRAPCCSRSTIMGSVVGLSVALLRLF